MTNSLSSPRKTSPAIDITHRAVYSSKALSLPATLLTHLGCPMLSPSSVTFRCRCTGESRPLGDRVCGPPSDLGPSRSCDSRLASLFVTHVSNVVGCTSDNEPVKLSLSAKPLALSVGAALLIHVVDNTSSVSDSRHMDDAQLPGAAVAAV